MMQMCLISLISLANSVAQDGTKHLYGSSVS